MNMYLVWGLWAKELGVQLSITCIDGCSKYKGGRLTKDQNKITTNMVLRKIKL